MRRACYWDTTLTNLLWDQGTDAKDALLGRVFAYAAVARSGRVGGDSAEPAESARVAAALVDAMQRKTFLREVC